MDYNREYYTNGIVQLDAAKELIRLMPMQADSVLDIGCGSGKVSHLIYEYILPNFMLAIDSSSEMINQARLIHPDSKVVFSHQKIEQFVSHHFFDLITSNSSFQWFQDYDASINAIKSALNPSGVFVLQTPYKQDWCPQVSILMNEFFTRYYPDLGQRFTLPCMHFDYPEQYADLFESKNFTTTSLTTRNFEYRFTGDDFRKFFMSGAYKVYTHEKSYSVAIPERFAEDLERFVIEKSRNQCVFEITISRMLASFRSTL
ncbi:methyltransferase domain-containing protein [Vibrio sp.]|uniref:class I SAM-dependent methyltransferase n=1 Tax=Vibrio sp. TaxID=678 RepID=UPI00311DCC64